MEKNLVELTQKRILQYIADNDYKLKSVLPKENELAEQLGVSRVVVREALSRLRALGFIETKRRKGTVLTMPEIFGVLKTILYSGFLDKDTMEDLLELRLMLEIGMSDFIYKRKTEKDIKKLQEIVDMEENETSIDKLIALDVKFHETLYSIARNKGLSDFQGLLTGVFSSYAPRSTDWKVKQIISHAGLLEVLKIGSASDFRAAMRLHLNTQFENNR